MAVVEHNRDISMIKRCVTLPNGRECGLGVYVNAWRKLRTMDANTQVKGFDHFPDRADSILRELRWGLNDRINHHIKGYGVGRKWSQDWQRAASQAARAVNTPRLIVYWVPCDLRKRLAHRVTTGEC
jgi:hypothetical protein